MSIRYFVDVDGVIWSINSEGQTGYPADIEIVGDTVHVLGAYDDLGPGRLIEEEYQLWPSLTSLAKVIESELNKPSVAESCPADTQDPRNGFSVSFIDKGHYEFQRSAPGAIDVKPITATNQKQVKGAFDAWLDEMVNPLSFDEIV